MVVYQWQNEVGCHNNNNIVKLIFFNIVIKVIV